MSSVRFTTNHGTFVVELNAEKAPNTVANFIEYVNAGFYNGTIFHRVISNFMIQGGGFEAVGARQHGMGLLALRWLVALARVR